MSSWIVDPTSRAVVLAVLRHGPVSRKAVGDGVGLSSGSITRLTRPLIERGILAECAPEPAGIGRPSLPLVVVDEAASFLGVKVVSGALHTVVTGLRGTIQTQATLAADTTSVESTADAIRRLLDASGGAKDVVAVGVSLAAAVDIDGALRAVDFLGWKGGNISEAVSERTNLPCASANDVDALTLAEHWFGHGRGIHDFAVLTIGDGVGSGAITADQTLLGHHGAGPMLGAAWLPDGRPLHRVLRSSTIAEAASRVVGRDMTHEEALYSRDERARAVLDDAAAALGHLVGLTAIAYDPQRILLTGDGVALLDGRMDIVRRALDQHRFFDIDPPELVVGKHNFSDWAVGAAALAIKLVLSGP